MLSTPPGTINGRVGLLVLRRVRRARRHGGAVRDQRPRGAPSTATSTRWPAMTGATAPINGRVGLLVLRRLVPRGWRSRRHPINGRVGPLVLRPPSRTVRGREQSDEQRPRGAPSTATSPARRAARLRLGLINGRVGPLVLRRSNQRALSPVWSMINGRAGPLVLLRTIGPLGPAEARRSTAAWGP